MLQSRRALAGLPTAAASVVGVGGVERSGSLPFSPCFSNDSSVIFGSHRQGEAVPVGRHGSLPLDLPRSAAEGAATGYGSGRSSGKWSFSLDAFVLPA